MLSFSCETSWAERWRGSMVERGADNCAPDGPSIEVEEEVIVGA